MADTNQRRQAWGNWACDGFCLFYRAPLGVPDPAYDFVLDELKNEDVAASWVTLIRDKSWASQEDVRNLSRACDDLLQERYERNRAAFADEDECDAPPAMDHDSYAAAVTQKWQTFLDTADPKDERAFQAFLEHYPVLLPDTYPIFGGGHNGAHMGAVITQPELPGLRAKRPDFMIVTYDSATVIPVLIEIEAPGKPWANEDGTPSALLGQAINQLRDWRAWFSETYNVEQFRRAYRISDEALLGRQLSPRYVLIYGRRREAIRSEAFAKKRRFLSHPDEEFMTFDRLAVRDHYPRTLTIRLDRRGADTRFRLISLPPTFELNRNNVADFFRLTGREQAIIASEWMTPERRSFLLERLRVADEYARAEEEAFNKRERARLR